VLGCSACCLLSLVVVTEGLPLVLVDVDRGRLPSSSLVVVVPSVSVGVIKSVINIYRDGLVVSWLI
jgi:hypothetical protein